MTEFNKLKIKWIIAELPYSAVRFPFAITYNILYCIDTVIGSIMSWCGRVIDYLETPSQSAASKYYNQMMNIQQIKQHADYIKRMQSRVQKREKVVNE